MVSFLEPCITLNDSCAHMRFLKTNAGGVFPDKLLAVTTHMHAGLIHF